MDDEPTMVRAQSFLDVLGAEWGLIVVEELVARLLRPDAETAAAAMAIQAQWAARDRFHRGNRAVRVVPGLAIEDGLCRAVELHLASGGRAEGFRAHLSKKLSEIVALTLWFGEVVTFCPFAEVYGPRTPSWFTSSPTHGGRRFGEAHAAAIEWLRPAIQPIHDLVGLERLLLHPMWRIGPEPFDLAVEALVRAHPRWPAVVALGQTHDIDLDFPLFCFRRLVALCGRERALYCAETRLQRSLVDLLCDQLVRELAASGVAASHATAALALPGAPDDPLAAARSPTPTGFSTELHRRMDELRRSDVGVIASADEAVRYVTQPVIARDAVATWTLGCLWLDARPSELEPRIADGPRWRVLSALTRSRIDRVRGQEGPLAWFYVARTDGALPP